MSNFQLHSDLIGYFPLLVNGLVPDSWDIFTPVSNNPSEFWCTMGSTPEGSSHPVGTPAVVVACLKRAGMTGVSFTISDDAGSTRCTETFDIIPPEPASRVISVDEANILTGRNPSPPIV